MYGWVPANLPCGNIIVSRMKSQTENVVCVGGVEPLLVGGASIDHTQCCHMIDDVTVFGVEEVVATVVTTVTIRR